MAEMARNRHKKLPYQISIYCGTFRSAMMKGGGGGGGISGGQPGVTAHLVTKPLTLFYTLSNNHKRYFALTEINYLFLRAPQPA